MADFMFLIVQCIYPLIDMRPTMSYVVMELDGILEKERSMSTIVSEITVILGSQLFKATT
ncbi:unnamed protein product [Lupinus luteus]|uniref:Uncharacterized protein n=1 Tax=Lupinus luteus TaxID=3873 RepID=A0AAV1VQT4_LUPLU